MGLAEDIKQEKFISHHQKALINIIYTNNWISEKMRDVLGPEGLTPQQFNVLRILRGSDPDPLSTLQIRERMLDKMSDTSRIVDRLISKGLAAKKTCRLDKRLVDISITELGLSVLKKLDSKSRQLQGLLSNLSEGEAAQLSDMLDKIRE